jgi:glutathione S-transferase
MFFAAGPVEYAVSNKALGFNVPPERERMIGYGTVAQALDTLEMAVSRTPYVAGDNFTAADVYVGSHIGFGMMFGTIDKRPAFEKYWQRISSRPACVRAKELDEAAVKAMKRPGN